MRTLGDMTRAGPFRLSLAPRAGAQCGARPPVDASMGPLREMMEHPLDAGYAMAARRRAGGEREPNRMITLILAAALAFLSVWAVTTLRAPQPDAVEARAALQRQIEERTAVVATLRDANTRLRQEIANAQAGQLKRQGGQQLVERAKGLGVVSGELPVTGPGLEITLNDAPGVGDNAVGVDPRQNANSQDGRVLDRDIQIVVNGLWAAGAEAVSINDERLTSLSAIRSAGQAILVDYRPLLPPYAVRAVGDPAGLQSGFAADMAGPYVRSLQDNYHIQAAIAEEHRLTVPGAGQLSLRYATVPRAGATGSATPGSTGSGAASPGVRSSSATSSGPSEVSP